MLEPLWGLGGSHGPTGYNGVTPPYKIPEPEDLTFIASSNASCQFVRHGIISDMLITPIIPLRRRRAFHPGLKPSNVDYCS